MLQTTITGGGHIQIPIELLEELQLLDGDLLELRKIGHNIMLSPKKEPNLMDLCAYLPKPSRSLSLEDVCCTD